MKRDCYRRREILLDFEAQFLRIEGDSFFNVIYNIFLLSPFYKLLSDLKFLPVQEEREEMTDSY
jgi:hypothetical protein